MKRNSEIKGEKIMSELDDFRAETRAWLAENCPPGARGPGPVSNGSTKIKITDADTLLCCSCISIG